MLSQPISRFHQKWPSSLGSWSVAYAPDQEQQLRRQVQLQEQQFQLQEMQLQQQEPGAGLVGGMWKVEPKCQCHIVYCAAYFMHAPFRFHVHFPWHSLGIRAARRGRTGTRDFRA